MGRRKKARYSVEDISEAIGKSYRTVLRHERMGRFDYYDFGSVVRYIREEDNRRVA